VGQIAAALAEEMGLPEAEVELIRLAAPLHDLGKIGIPDHILLKPGQLTEDEFARMKTHTVIGARLLSGGQSRLLQLAEEIALFHHERWDGNGYAGLSGEAIPLAARIVSVVDVFDALTFARPYKSAWPVEQVRAEIEGGSGTHFDPRVVDALLRILDRGGLARLLYPAHFSPDGPA
jgi:putative two-component system response regulator